MTVDNVHMKFSEKTEALHLTSEFPSGCQTYAQVQIIGFFFQFASVRLSLQGYIHASKMEAKNLASSTIGAKERQLCAHLTLLYMLGT